MYKILVADDEKALRLLVVGTLEIGDYNVLEADNGIDALKMTIEARPDLIILDVMMPGMTGYEVCKQIKTNPELIHTKVLILSAKGQQTDREAAKEVLADCYLAKPFSPMELLSRVEKILSGQVKT